MMKKKLLIFHPTIAPYRIDFFNSLNDEFEAHICLTWGDEGTFNYNSIYSQLNFRPILLKKWFEIGSRRINRGYWEKLREINPDIVITDEFGLVTIIVLLHRWLHNKKYKVVSMCDDSYNMLAEDNDFSRFHNWARNIVAPKLDELIVVEPKTKEWYQNKIGKGYFFPIIRRDDKQRMIYERLIERSTELMKSFNLSDKNVFLFVGRFVALKNIPNIIEAFSHLNQKENALVLVGSGEEESIIKMQAQKAGVKAIFTGRLEGDELYAWYNVADYFILASWQEAFGAVINEALLAGCYSIVSKRAGANCLIKDGVNGVLFNPMDVEDLKKSMQEVIIKFPKIRPLMNVKKNLMLINYDNEINNLIAHIKSL